MLCARGVSVATNHTLAFLNCICRFEAYHIAFGSISFPYVVAVAAKDMARVQFTY